MAKAKAAVKATPKKEKKTKGSMNASVRRYLGAHMSIAGGVPLAVTRAAELGTNAFALFTRNQRTWNAPPRSQDEVEQFKQAMVTHKISPQHIVPHGSYLVNLANPDPEKFRKSLDLFLDEMRRCEALGLQMLNFHPGSTVGTPTEAGLRQIASAINTAHKETTGVMTVLENCANGGSVIGGPFAHLRGIIDHVEDKSRVGVCLDTCHLFAYGHDISTAAGFDAVMTEFDRIVGAEYLKAWHLNDSKDPLGSRKDRHATLGTGHIPVDAFRYLMTRPRFAALPMVLETPEEGVAKDLALLRKLEAEGAAR